MRNISRDRVNAGFSFSHRSVVKTVVGGRFSAVTDPAVVVRMGYIANTEAAAINGLAALTAMYLDERAD